MAKEEWGTKHTCGACEAIFYDLMKPAPVCPSCGVKVKLVRGATTAVSNPPPKPVTKSKEAAIGMLDIENDDDLPIEEDSDAKELLEQVEEDVEEDVKEVIETNVNE